MVKIFRDWGKGVEGYRHFVRQKKLMEAHFPLFSCSYSKRRLTCIGNILPAYGCATYKVKIEYVAGKVPQVWVVNPKIERSSEIHLYRDGSLCLFYPPESPWKHTDNLHEKIVPWTAEWLVFYELYLLTGDWQGKSAPSYASLATRQPRRRGLEFLQAIHIGPVQTTGRSVLTACPFFGEIVSHGHQRRRLP